MIEADFGLRFKRSARSKAHAAAEQRFAIQDIADVNIDLDQEDDAEQTSGVEAFPIDTREDIARARRAAVTFEYVYLAELPVFNLWIWV